MGMCDIFYTKLLFALACLYLSLDKKSNMHARRIILSFVAKVPALFKVRYTTTIYIAQGSTERD
jgi:hypothetical protein